MPGKLIPVGVTNRHFHISQKDLEPLFGAGYKLRNLRNISQRGQFACHETLDVEGPKGKITGIRIVGPARGQTQLELARSDAYRLGIDPPVRYSGDLRATAGIQVIGPAGQIELSEGVIVPQRHIHMSPSDASNFGVRNGDRVFVAPAAEGPIDPGCEARTVIFGNVLIRVDDSFVLDFHIDIDEANAAGLKTGDHVHIVGHDRQTSSTRPVATGGRLITENDVRQALLRHRKIVVPEGAKITPAALELGKAHGVFEW